jgi:hypothetical protein
MRKTKFKGVQSPGAALRDNDKSEKKPPSERIPDNRLGMVKFRTMWGKEAEGGILPLYGNPYSKTKT